ncbi:DUF4129 domain-containing protein [Quadrisphaera sp. INWT6]|uniref:DUF4129 domain-containing protein n=1 Tax=Quadrisphaera sp. INWT6 TaxID=2596917 RepID=UPI0018924758|nr:DUF4129 domain-containing protein [Quadrisphaera sp. INWT6]MBF5081422.1 DUF4129 domain-containing protein [Quadrisphaera sp. INWT6]
MTLLTNGLTSAVLAGAPLQPSAEEARRAAQRELSQQVYRQAEPGLLQRLVDALLDALGRVQGPSGGGVLQVVVVVLVVVAVLVVALVLVRRTGRAAGRAAAAGTASLTGPASADQLRAAARRAAQEGRHDDAALDGFRALVRSLQDRDLVPSTPGLTASEAARAASAELPGLADRFGAAARLFDGVLYGDRRATADDAAGVAALDADAAATRPAASAGTPAGRA